MIMVLRCTDARGIQIPSLRRNLSYGDVFEAGKELIEKNRELQYFIRVGSLEVKEKTSSFPTRVREFPKSPVYQKPLTEQAIAHEQQQIRPINPVNSLNPPPPPVAATPQIDMNALAEMIASKINLKVEANPTMVMSNNKQVPSYSSQPDELVFIPSTIVDTEQKVSRPLSSEKATGDDVSDALKALKKLRKGGG